MRLSCMALCLFAMAGAAGENLYRDPGFEQSGVEGMARTGARAGFVQVEAQEHWRTIGGAFPVEPYATYRATGWAKATFTSGAAQALHVYQWDSYVWAFSTCANVPNGQDWQEVSSTFRVPQHEVFFSPLVLMDTSQAKAWIDDVTIEKVMTPEETIAAIEALPTIEGDDARLLARWYVEHKAFDKALQLLDRVGAAPVKADIACVIAKATEDRALQEKMLETMLLNGAPELNAGTQRLIEVASLLQPAQPAAFLFDLIVKHTNDPAVLKYFASFVASTWKQSERARPVSIALQQANLDRLRQAMAGIATALGDGAAKNEHYARLVDEANKWQEELAEAAKHLGQCTITMGGKRVAPDTHAIVLAATPTPQEALAAQDLQMHIERISGKAIPIVSDQQYADKACFSIGKNAFTESLALGINYDQLGLEGIRIVSRGPHLVLTGNKRGVLYATYVLLEEHLGCRWFSPDCATWPAEGAISLGDLDITYVPPFEYRDTDYPSCRPPEFGVRNRLNGLYSQAPEEWGGKISYRGFVHTFNYLVPPDQYFDAHPEYFSEIDGKRVKDHTQMCLTNPDVLRIATEAVRQWIKESPEASIISVSQNDWHNYCRCAKCTALAEAEGSQSGPLLHFVNAIADAIAAEHPDVIIDTLAYQYTRKPPKSVKPRPNVVVRLCSIECEFNRPLATSEFNASFVNDIKGWHANSNRLHIWDYVINYAHCVEPFPNLYVLQPNIQFFRDNGVTGIYEEANYFSQGGEFAELRAYILAKLLWNPEYNVDQAIDEFCQAYYGKCWKLIREYINDTHRRAVANADLHMTIWNPPTAPYQTDEALAMYTGLFDEAEATMQDDPVRLKRVQTARLPILYSKLARRPASAYELAEAALVITPAGQRIQELANRFQEIAAQAGLTHVSEGGLVDAWLASVRAAAEAVPVVRIKNTNTEAVVVPSMGGRIFSLQHDGQEWMNVVHSNDGVDPRAGGYKEFSEMGYESPGWIEPYTVVEQTERSVVLEGTFQNGLKFHRRYELDEQKPVLRVATTLTNAGNATESTGMRTHPCFSLKDAVGAKLRLGAGASAREIALDEGAQQEKEQSVPCAEMPGNEWAFTDAAAGHSIISRFKPEQVHICYFNWSGPDHRANLELWTPTKELAPGGTITLEHEFEFVTGP